ncbi:DUF5615 family PIN-like protein [Acidobacteria bacterium AH-259-L09]|nr:DUF5615 family PIN-like protein [Acidobacteria bacterium AH-259-L09]
MRVLLDESLPRGLKGLLLGHDVRTVVEQGWRSTRNSDLLRLAESEFHAFVTADQGMEHEQNLEQFDLGVIILVARSNRLADYEPLAASLVEAVNDIKPGELRKIAAEQGAAADRAKRGG